VDTEKENNSRPFIARERKKKKTQADSHLAALPRWETIWHSSDFQLRCRLHQKFTRVEAIASVGIPCETAEIWISRCGISKYKSDARKKRAKEEANIAAENV
jgi:hypothetical protein